MSEYGRVEVWRNGKVVQTSKNLRGLITYAGRVTVRLVVVTGRRLVVQFADGSTCEVVFASYAGLRQWVGRRLRRWHPETVIVDGILRDVD